MMRYRQEEFTMPKDLTVRFYEYGPAPGINFHGISHDDVHIGCGLDSSIAGLEDIG